MRITVQKFKFLNITIALTFLIITLTGCQNPYTASYYKGTDVGELNTVLNGVIVARTPITIDRSEDRSSLNSGSVVTGGFAGGILGNTIGQGNGNALATGIGILAGVCAGQLAANAMNKFEGYDYQIRLTDGRVVSITQAVEPQLSVGQQVTIIQASKGRSRVIPAN